MAKAHASVASFDTNDDFIPLGFPTEPSQAAARPNLAARIAGASRPRPPPTSPLEKRGSPAIAKSRAAAENRLVATTAGPLRHGKAKQRPVAADLNSDGDSDSSSDSSPGNLLVHTVQPSMASKPVKKTSDSSTQPPVASTSTRPAASIEQQSDFIAFAFSPPDSPLPAPEPLPLHAIVPDQPLLERLAGKIAPVDPDKEERFSNKKGGRFLLDPDKQERLRPKLPEPPVDGPTAARKKAFKAKAAKLSRTEVQALQEKKFKQRQTPWCANVDWDGCSSAIQMLTKELQAFKAYVTPSRAEHAFRGHVIDQVRNALRQIWADTDLQPFGSYLTQLYLPGGDIDLVMLSATAASQTPSRVLHRIAQIMRDANIGYDFVVISRAKVPIVKFISTTGGFNIDISLNQPGGIRAGTVVQRMIDHNGGEAARTLIYCIKLYLSIRGMSEVFTGGLGSYSLICMVISFFQIHPKVQSGSIDLMESLGPLLIDFFDLYGRNFNYDLVGITVKESGYYNKWDRGFYNAMKPFALSIEDPNDPTNDISVGSFNIRQIRITLAGAYEVLTASVFNRQLVIHAQGDRRQDAALSASLPAAPGSSTDGKLMHETLLGTIMGVSQAVIDQRATNAEQAYQSLGVRDTTPIGPDRLGDSTSATSALVMENAGLVDGEPIVVSSESEAGEETDSRCAALKSARASSRKRQRSKQSNEFTYVTNDAESDSEDEVQRSNKRPSVLDHLGVGDDGGSDILLPGLSKSPKVSDEVKAARKMAAEARQSYWLAKSEPAQTGRNGQPSKGTSARIAPELIVLSDASDAELPDESP
ncbi:hypothetical protein E5Q_05645 [Mixia osmundae IAM 14324]|uniref:polynucleotide adenylyltransferase n=1 Tax=Mixia osmundae (strain CBS 9802 / IAM 14324 / JCM 22182 / KY 12970) TaxID=764103 RepID=G7E7Z7_MIXOS|nr:hypothetical protein E5Q_05645 [Mixia osmundae IAM 14324]